jgi:HK97 gp10 family phage protein
VNVTIEGLEELNRRLEKLEDVGKKPILTKALKIRADAVRDAAKSRAPRRTGALAGDIMRGPSFGASLYEAVIQVGTHTVDHGFYQEFGTGSSFQAAAARALGYPGQGSRASRNMPAQPFLIPAVRATESSSIAAIERELQTEIHKAENA